MTAEILSIGTELLVGSILNTNARFLSEKLAENANNARVDEQLVSLLNTDRESGQDPASITRSR